ncbi:hypothetical protein ECANGB1_455 [Enterospora canceri]|uniref:Uncharacterized protein n=1 Tax=Enterospora canceri TaxID=1081671 RepID=A0A1Y1S8S8_9MICR|nr:hypothetical protein ECANGB1_455 [Enterospora canceri]
MISSMGFLSKQTVVTYNEFKVLNEFNRAKYTVPGAEYREPGDEVELEEPVGEDETRIFATVNRDDFSCLAHFASNGEAVYCNHDLFVPNTVINGCRIEVGGREAVALGTFDEGVLVYDPLVEFSPYPIAVLSGHRETVSFVCSDGELLYSAAGREIIRWDLGRMEAGDRFDTGIDVERVVADGRMLYYSEGDTVIAYDTSSPGDYVTINSIGSVESFCISGRNLFVGNSEGGVECFDLRETRQKRTMVVGDGAVRAIQRRGGDDEAVSVVVGRSLKTLRELAVVGEFGLSGLGCALIDDGATLFVGTEDDKIDVFTLKE